MKRMLKLGLLITATAIVPSYSYAKSANIEVSVTVQNAFELEATELSFGTIRATADTTTSGTGSMASLIIPSNPSQSPTTESEDLSLAQISILEDGAPAEVTVSGVAKYTTLNITPPADVELVGDAAPSTARFTVTDFTYYVTSSANGEEQLDTSSTLTIQADGDGQVTFNLGATLKTDNGGDTVTDYADTNYRE